jgi:hypothetical protein
MQNIDNAIEKLFDLKDTLLNQEIASTQLFQQSVLVSLITSISVIFLLKFVEKSLSVNVINVHVADVEEEFESEAEGEPEEESEAEGDTEGTGSSDSESEKGSYTNASIKSI